MRISIVTITYNAASTLRPTLDSVAMQEHDDVEHIIVDGASTDATADIARQYAEAEAQSDNGHEVIVMSEPDHGLYDFSTTTKMRRPIFWANRASST